MATVSNPVHVSSEDAAAQAKQRIMQATSGYMISAALHTMVRLRVADHLGAGALPIAQLAARTGANEDALYRVLRALVSVGIFAEPTPKTIGLNPPAEMLRSDRPGSMRDMVLWVGNRFHWQVWADMEYSVKTGEPAVEHVFGKGCFEVFSEQPEVASDFNTAMTCMSAQLAPALLEAYDFSGIGTLMDVAGGHGFVLCEVLRAYPQMKGILFDVESVIEGAKCRVCDIKMDHRCETVEGDFFREIPAGADAYYMQHIIHDWPDDKALQILGNCRRALQGHKGGKLLVVDAVLPENSEPHFAKFLDLEMLLMPGGRERTEREFRELFAKAGFEITRIVPMKAANSVIESRVR